MTTGFNGVKVFSATKCSDRSVLGERVTDWLRKNPGAEVVDKVAMQSSDREFHCVTIVLFFRTAPTVAVRRRR